MWLEVTAADAGVVAGGGGAAAILPVRGGGISPAVFLLNTRSVGRGSRKGLWVFQRSFQAGIEVSRVVEGVAVLLLHIICIFLRDRSSWIMVKLPIGH